VNGTEQRFFFVHVMKTAGTTFVAQLQQHFAPETIYPHKGVDWTSATDIEPYKSIPQLLALPPERRAGIRVFTGHFPYYVCPLVDPEAVTLTLLREPVERTVSVLKHFKRNDRYRDLSLEEIYTVRPIFRFFVENHQTKIFALAPEDNEEAINCGMDIDDARFERALANLASVDVVGLTESYEDFIADVRARFGWWPRGIDLRARANVSAEAWDLDPDFRSTIESDNAYDVRLYQYAKGLAAKAAIATHDGV